MRENPRTPATAPEACAGREIPTIGKTAPEQTQHPKSTLRRAPQAEKRHIERLEQPIRSKRRSDELKTLENPAQPISGHRRRRRRRAKNDSLEIACQRMESGILPLGRGFPRKNGFRSLSLCENAPSPRFFPPKSPPKWAKKNGIGESTGSTNFSST